MNIKKSAYIKDVFEQYKISITDSGFACVGEEWNSPYVCSPFTRLYYITEGEGLIKYKGGEMRILEGNLHLIPLGTKYSCRCFDKLEHLYFHINIDSPSGYDLLRGAKCVGAPIPIEKIRKLTELYFSSALSDQIELRSEICRSIQTVLTLQPSKTQIEPRLSPETVKAIEYIRSNLSIQLTANEIADNLYVSKNTLAKNFRHEVGIPIGKYIDKQVFFEAEILLTKSSMSVGEISSALGFCDQFYFSRRFRQLFEETPLAYRKRVRAFTT